MGAEIIKLCADCAHLKTQVCSKCFAKDCWYPANSNVQQHLEDLTDVANQPHYTCFKIQPIEFAKANELGFLEGNVIKYICRYPYKGTPLKDLYKAKDYIEHLIQKEKEKCYE
jgi:hypothetical protein